MIHCPESIIACASRFRQVLREAIYPRLHRLGLWIVELTAPAQNLDTTPVQCLETKPTQLVELTLESIELSTESTDQKTSTESSAIATNEDVNTKTSNEVPENYISEAAYKEAIAELNSINDHRASREVEVGAVCNVLEVLERQLQEVNKDVESSVTGVCLGFQGMANRAQAAIKAAESAVDSSATFGDGDLITRMRTAVSTLVQSIQQSSEFSQSLSEKLDKLELRLTAVQKTLKDVEALANKAKLVALNGQIEASRLGAAGAAVGVVARETKNLSTHAAATSDSIRVLVSELAKELKSTSAEIRVRTQTDAVCFADAEQLAQSLLNDIDVNNRRMLQSLGVTGQMGNELRCDIGKAVMSMQFQDRVSQCITHVIETMETLVVRVSENVPHDFREAANERSSQWLREFASRCTMESERAALGQGELAGCASEVRCRIVLKP